MQRTPEDCKSNELRDLEDLEDLWDPVVHEELDAGRCVTLFTLVKIPTLHYIAPNGRIYVGGSPSVTDKQFFIGELTMIRVISITRYARPFGHVIAMDAKKASAR